MSSKDATAPETAPDRPYENSSYIEAYRYDDLTRIESEVFDTYLTREDRVLDFGCGGGRVSLRIAGQVREVVGVDISEAAIRRAVEKAKDRGTSNVSFVVEEISSSPHEIGRFNRAIIAYNSIEAISPRTNRVRALQKICARLTVGGLLLLSIHNRFYYRTMAWILAQRLGLDRQRTHGPLGPVGRREWSSVVLATPDGSQRFPWYLYSLRSATADLTESGFRLLRSWRIEDQNPTTLPGLAAGTSKHRLSPLVPGFYLVCEKVPSRAR